MISFDEFLKQDECDKYNMLQECRAYIKSKDKEIERLTNIINEIDKILDEDVILRCRTNGRMQYNKTLTQGGLLFRDYIKYSLQTLKGE